LRRNNDLRKGGVQEKFSSSSRRKERASFETYLGESKTRSRHGRQGTLKARARDDSFHRTRVLGQPGEGDARVEIQARRRKSSNEESAGLRVDKGKS